MGVRMREGVRILMYHRVGLPRDGQYEKRTVLPERFVGQLDLLLRLGYTFRGLDAALACSSGETSGTRRQVILTFDDGFADLYEHVFPVLVARNIPAVVYAITDRDKISVTGQDEKEPFPLLSRSQLAEMAGSGITIGSHTRTHPHLTKCSPEQLRDELEGSKKTLEDLIGREVPHFCYPAGMYNDEVVEAVRSAGYRSACTTRRGVAGPASDSLCLPRLAIGKRMGYLRFLRRILLTRQE